MSAARVLLALCIVAAVCDAKLVFNNRRSYSSGSSTTTSGSGSGSSTSSGSGTSSGTTTPPPPAPTPAESSPIQITQVVTMSSPFTASTINTYGSSAYKTAVNFGYGNSIGIVTTSASATAYKTGCSVSSRASMARRANIEITFTAQVAAAQAALARSSANGLTAASLNTAVAAVIANLQQSDAATYGGLTVPTASAVASPTITTSSSTSGVSTTTVSMFTVFTAAAVALARQ